MVYESNNYSSGAPRSQLGILEWVNLIAEDKQADGTKLARVIIYVPSQMNPDVSARKKSKPS